MRNLKKILALVLALVMSFSLMATANAFTDDANVDATYDEAVTVLSNLKVFQGYEDGSFQPKGSITRAEVAAIIYRIATGDVTDSQVGIYADYNKFSDVKSTSWYAGYVNYCANAEYIKGYDAKTFGPNDPVTGYQALAMILRAVGYDKNGEFTGTGWTVQTAAVGKQLHITDNVSAGTLNSAATREVVAEILFRSILVPQVTYTPALGYQSIGVSSTGNVLTGWFVDNASIGAETFGLAQTTGEITATNRKTGTTTLTPVVTRSNNDNVLDTANRVDVINTPGDWTQIGYAAYVYTVPTANAKTRTAVSDVTITGTSLGTSTNGTSIANLSTKSNAAFIGELAGAGTTVRYYYNGVECTQATAAAAADRIGVKVDFIDNDNGGLVEVVVVTAYTSAYVTAITNENNTGFQGVQANSYYLNNIAVKSDNLVCADTLAYQDLVTYVEYNGVYYVTKAPLTQNTFNRITRDTVNGNAYLYVIGETEYRVSDLGIRGSGNFLVASQTLVSSNLGKGFDVYTDPYGHIIYAAPTATNYSYMFVLANDHTVATTGLTNARIVNTDGSIANVNIAKATGYSSVIEVNALAGHMYGYTVNADGSYNVTKCYDLTNVSYDKKTATMYGTEGNRGVNNATVVVDLRGVTVNSTAATAVYTGYNEIPTFTGGELHYVAVNNWISFAFLTNGIADLTNNFIVYDTGINGETVINGEHYFYLDVIVNGEKQENYQLTAKEYGYIDTYGVGEYSITKTGVLKEYTAFPEEWVTATWTNGGLYVKATDTYYTYGDGIPFVVLDITNGTATNYGMIQGRDYHVYLHKGGTAVTEIYIVVGDLATSYTEGITMPTQVKDNATYTYYVKDRMITNYIDDLFQTSAPSVVLENSNPVVPTWTQDSDYSFSVTVPYSTWKNWIGKDFVVTPATSNQIAVDNRYTFTASSVKVGVAVIDSDKLSGKTQEIVVYSQSLASDSTFGGTKAYTFTITYEAAETSVILTSKNEKVATVDNDNSVINVLDRNLSINEFMANFEAPQGATVEWTFWNAQGVVAEKDYFQTMQNVTDFSVKVTAQDGKTTKTYNDKIEATLVVAGLKTLAAGIDSAEDAAAAEAAVEAAEALLANTSYTDTEKAAIQAAIDEVNAAIENYNAQVTADAEAAEKYAEAVKAAEAALAKKDDYAALVDAEADLNDLEGLDDAQKAEVDALLKDIAAAKAAIVEQKAYEQFQEIVANAQNILDVAADEGDIPALQDQLANLNDLTPEDYTKVSAQEWLDVVALKDAIKTKIAELTPAEPEVDPVQDALDAAQGFIDNAITTENVDAAKAALETLKALLERTDITVAEEAALQDAHDTLDTAITDFEQAQADLQTAKGLAKDALAAYYDSMTINRSDEDAAKAIYDAYYGTAETTGEIDAALTVDAVNSLRDEAILALSKLDQDVVGAGASLTELAKVLAAAGTQTNEIVGILKAEGATVLQQAQALYGVNTDNNMNVILPVLYNADYSVKDIYEGYISNGRDVDEITAVLAGEDAQAPAAAIIAGYVDYWMVKPTGLTDVTVTEEEDGSYTVAVKSDGTIQGTGLQKLLMNCGLDLDSVKFQWKTYDVTFAEFLAGSPSSHWNNMMNNVKAGKGNYDLTIVADGLSYVIHLVHAE